MIFKKSQKLLKNAQQTSGILLILKQTRQCAFKVLRKCSVVCKILQKA